MPQYAELVYQLQEGTDGRWYRTVTGWSGDHRWPVLLPGNADLSKYPFPLRLVEEQGASDFAVYVRTDVGIPLYGQLFRLRTIAVRTARNIKSRLIYTAAVWGLAYIPFGETPQWSHLGKKR